MEEARTSMQIAQNASGFASVLGNALSILTPIMSIMGIILTLQQATNNATLRGIMLKKEENKTETEGLVPKASGMFAKVVQAFSDGSIPGVIAGIAIATALAAALGVVIAASLGAFSGDTKADKAADEINQLSVEIYKLNEQATAIDKVTDSFDRLDDKLIKTKADLEEMTNLMKQAAEQLSDEGDFSGGQTEKEWFLSQDEETQRLYLNRKQIKIKNELRQKRNEQKQKIKSLSSEERSKLFNENSTDADIIAAQGAIYALNNAELYNHIDALKEDNKLNEQSAAAIESVTQAMLENMSVSDAWKLVENPDKIAKLTEQFAALELQVKDTTGKIKKLTAAEILDSEDYSMRERVQAYEMMRDELSSLGSEFSEVLVGFKEEYAGMEVFAQMSDDVLDFIESVGLSTEEINELYNA